MTYEEVVEEYIAKDDAKGLREWELTHTVSDTALLQQIDAFLKSRGEWYGDNAQKEGA